jgi:outer membrane immunogenic protein
MKTPIKIAIAVAATTLIVGHAGAADMPVKAPPPTQTLVPSWEGFYLGGDIGYSMGVSRISSPEVNNSGNSFQNADFFGNRGFTGGVLAGYNHMLAPRWLIGLEGDATWSYVTHDECFCDPFDSLSLQLKQSEAYSARGRVGYLVTPTTLLYATGGWSWSKFSYFAGATENGVSSSSISDKFWVNGPVVGAGIETMLGAGWNARIEYLEQIYRTGGFNVEGVLPVEVRPTMGTGRFALIYRFGAGDVAAPSQPTPTPSWSGFTIAGTVAAITGNVKLDSPQEPGSSVNGVGASAVLPTVLLGYNWRVAPRWVFGIDGGAAPGISTADLKVDWTEAAHARLGYLLTPATMLYGSVGWFASGLRTTSLLSNEVIIPAQRANALEIGAGIESALTDHLAWRFEYQYGFMQTIHNISVTATNNTGSETGLINAHPQIQSAQLGLVYTFDGR